jgi:hypothetical protein
MLSVSVSPASRYTYPLSTTRVRQRDELDGATWTTATPALRSVREVAPAYATATPVMAPLRPSGLIDTTQLHQLAKNAHAIGNEARKTLIDVLRKIRDGRLYYELGYSTFENYCDREFGIARSTAYEYMRVSAALEYLPRLRVLFSKGDMSWHQVREITKVAKADTEIEWIELTCEVSVRKLMAEVRAAQRSGRERPRDGESGLPNLHVTLSIDVTLEEKERLIRGLALVPEALSEHDRDHDSDHDGGNHVAPRDLKMLLLHLADGLLSGELRVTRTAEGCPCGAPMKPLRSQMIVYHERADGEATLATDSGPVAVPAERIAALAPLSEWIGVRRSDEPGEVESPTEAAGHPEVECPAEAVGEAVGDREVAEVAEQASGEIDRPTNARLAREILSRDSMRCTSPGCSRRRNLHVHHIQHRSKGGRTAADNLTTVCDTCHALLHSGRLDVAGSAPHRLAWTMNPNDPGVGLRTLERLRVQMAEIDATAAESRFSSVLNSPGGVPPQSSGGALLQLPGSVLPRSMSAVADTGELPATDQPWLRGGPAELPDPGSDEQLLRRALMMKGPTL